MSGPFKEALESLCLLRSLRDAVKAYQRRALDNALDGLAAQLIARWAGGEEELMEALSALPPARPGNGEGEG